MNIHEYQGKSILKEYGVPVPVGFIAESPESAVDAAKNNNNNIMTSYNKCFTTFDSLTIMTAAKYI